jgi:hypothetical protein
MLHGLHREESRASLKVEQLEDRNVMSVFVTPTVIPVNSLRHLHDLSHKHGEAGGVITVHILADDAAGQALVNSPLTSLKETVTLNGVTTALGMPRAVGVGGVELELKFSRADLKTALGSQLGKVTGTVPVMVTVTNGTDTEFGTFFLVAHHSHDT